MPAMVKISIFKNWGGGNNQGWVNTHEFLNLQEPPVTSPIWASIVDALVDAERIIHLPMVNFIRAVIASYQEDSTPYNPSSFVTRPLSGAGERALGSQHAMDLNCVYNVRRVPESGRNGKIAYRGVLVEGDVDASASGFWKFQTDSPIQAGGALWAAYADAMSGILDGSLGADMVMVSGGATGASPALARPVVSLVPGTAGINRMNHRYFDRQP